MKLSTFFRATLVLAGVAFSLLLGSASTAHAQLVSRGATPTGGAGGSGGLNDVAFDDRHGVYLHVYGGPVIWGQFVGAGGDPIGARFAITGPPLTFANWLHVAYSTGGPADVFLVAFGAEYAANKGKSLFGQLVRFNGAGGELVGSSFPMSNVGITTNIFQSSGGITFSSRRQQFLVTWEDIRGSWDVFMRFVNPDGTMPDGEVNLSATGASGEGQPSVTYDWVQDRFLYVYKSWQSIGPAERSGVYAFLLDGDGNKISGRITVNEGFYRQELPGVVYLPETGGYLVFWMDEPKSGLVDIAGRTLAADGSPQGSVYSVLAPGWNGVPDADYDWVSRQILVAGQHDSGFIWSGTLSESGVPLATFKGSSAIWLHGGTYSPQVAAGANAEFGVGYVVDYAVAWLERFGAAPASTPGKNRQSVGCCGGSEPPEPTVIDLDSPNPSWFFAEGVATGDGMGFDTKYAIANETDEPVTIRGYFSKDDGTTVKKDTTVNARSRKTVSLKTEIGNGAFAAVFQSLTPSRQVYVSRSVTWGAGGYGSTAEVATAQRAHNWYFGEGSRKFEFFQNFFLIFNPGQTDANVKFTFFKPDGSSPSVEATVKAQSRYTLWANTIPELANSDFSLWIQASEAIVAERAMYWGGNFEGGHDSLGTTTPSSSWYFAEGAAAPGFDTYYTILNANDHDVTVDITYFLDADLGEAPIVRAYTVGKRSRFTVNLNTELGNVGGVSALITARNGQPIVAERSIYWGRSQFGVDGTNVVGATGPAMTWHLPDGSFESSVDSYVLIANPNASAVTAHVVVFLEDGRRFTEIKSIPARSRVTLHMATDFTSNPDDRAALNGQRYTAKVQSVSSGAPIFVEYANYSGRAGGDYWRAGSAAVGFPQ